MSKSKGAIAIFLILILFCYEPLRKLIKYKRFDFGGNTGIWSDTVNSEINMFLYHKDYPQIVFTLISIIIIISIAAYFIIALSKWIRGNYTINDKAGTFIYFSLLLILLSNSVQHYLLGSPFIAERFALFITPLFFLTLIYLLNEMLEAGKIVSYTALFFTPIITLLMCFHFSKAANDHYVLNWDYESDTKQMLKNLEMEKKLSGKSRIKLGITWWYEPTVNFYRETNKLSWLEPVNRKEEKGNYDYYYLNYDDKVLTTEGKVLIKEYPHSGSKLLK